ncbi:DUF305 domain-containing protein [Actinoplanes sp. NPDC049681]|uniref:DUF305 domain-containing protein n=1 Tax=Actinoplanes sp. NPDC049681 TaxID=3363905 RepID=UPI0037A20837
MRPPFLRTARLLLAVAMATGICACDSTPAPGTPAPAPSTAVFGGTDRAWIEITIAMDEELLPLLALVPANGADARLQDLSDRVGAVHERELAALRGLHDQAGLPAENPHKGMPMPGMVTPQQVTEAAATRGPAFDTLVVRHLTAHLDQGVKLAESERRSGVEPRTRTLAGQMIENRRTYLRELRELRHGSS